eukprot:CAMPEP_0172455762 /NCGR_PEP_ID=MMETSP1065-20121228/12231_1 /TAXON_ID=265537 /ORGANISM="Amphiprora paludosa, Strain CCMP125" /LENGTH=1384 /DNA_ID=CAMNT_0013208239 /DNA_START=266 /DNA_END=4420 /DNA_ORIENTATION=-
MANPFRKLFGRKKDKKKGDSPPAVEDGVNGADKPAKRKSGTGAGASNRTVAGSDQKQRRSSSKKTEQTSGPQSIDRQDVVASSASVQKRRSGIQMEENKPSSAPEEAEQAVSTSRQMEENVFSGSAVPAGQPLPNVNETSTGEEFDDEDESPQIVLSYESIPVLEQIKLPRGGVSVDTKAVGRIQFGIPPETIKDSMRLGIPVPQVYIVPVERFCREMGPALGVNLAEFEFPAYFNFFVYKKRCMLVVDSHDAEENIRRVFSETLLGPAQFRREDNPIAFEEEDFAPDFPRSAIPNFQKELKHFRIMPDGTELVIETLLDFCHFETRTDGHEGLGVPPPLPGDAENKTEEADEAADVEVEVEEPATNDEAENEPEVDVPKDETALESMQTKSVWSYSKAKFMGDVATIWPFGTTPEQIKNKSVPRVEVFKMPGGTEYIVHDIDVENNIIGKARFQGHVKVSESMSVDGFGGHSILDDVGHNKAPTETQDPSSTIENLSLETPPSFHPPSFGVTVLGNSHGFDKSGSVSGYVLWINGRGVMIDPPPYSSATLEREGIRPRMIVGIILTHCHADHDAGAFQKVLTGSPVVVITTPTIYKSFIRKYAALSALSPALLRHSHRYKRATIGEPLRFQGATFHFIYTLHTIPCVGFRVEWRGRSMVFTGDHFNSPPGIDKLEASGVLSKGRADDLRNLPLQETDVLLHEAGAPPIHTPLDVLLQLPPKVKKRLYVVHTSALPEGCELRVAPTGTAGTIRLDQSQGRHPSSRDITRSGESNSSSSSFVGTEEGFMWNGHSEYETISEEAESSPDPRMLATSLAHFSYGNESGRRKNSVFIGENSLPPLVSLRPASSTDAWFTLNLLSAVPFLSSLSYTSTMEVLETAKVDAYAMNEVVVPAARRSEFLCVVWEGTCSELSVRSAGSPRRNPLVPIEENGSSDKSVWHAGDWTGPIALQPDFSLSGESERSKSNDVVAVSTEGVKVITVEFSSLHAILKTGSPLYRRYLERKAHQERVKMDGSQSDRISSATPTDHLLDDALRNLNVLELLNCNSALRKLSAVQKRHLESLAEGPISFQPGERLWRAGTPVDRAFVIVSGTASFVPKRRNAGSAAFQTGSEKDKMGDPGVGDSMRVDALKAMKELGVKDRSGNDDGSMSSTESPGGEKIAQHIQFDTLFSKTTNQDTSSLSDVNDYTKLSQGLQKRADFLREGSVQSELSLDSEESNETDQESQLDYTFTDEQDPGTRSRRTSVLRRRSSRARFANKVLGRLYSRRAFTGGLVFSRGHFLGDVSKMVAGLLSNDTASELNEDFGHAYGFGDSGDIQGDNVLETITELIIHEQEGDHHIMHSSTLTAGKEGCVALLFTKTALIPFLDEYPGLLLSLLGTQVVV